MKDYPGSPTEEVLAANEARRHEMSDFDRNNIGRILRENLGTWYGAELLRALDKLLSIADDNNTAILKSAYPEQCRAILEWYAEGSR
jgi:hypothetical protein